MSEFHLSEISSEPASPAPSLAATSRENLRDILVFGVWMAGEVGLFAAHQAKLIYLPEMTAGGLLTAAVCGGYLLFSGRQR